MDSHPSLDGEFGAMFIGLILAAVLYGVACAQCFYYFQHYNKKDGCWTKGVVIVTLISDTVHQALFSHTVYTYLVTYRFQPQKLGFILWSPTIAVIPNGITALFVQTFYVVRIWKLGQRNVIIAAALFASIVGGFVSEIVFVAKAIKLTMIVELRTLEAIAVAITALTAISDVLITIVFCLLLHRTRSNLQRSNTMIDLLTVFAVQTGMLTSLCAVASFISNMASPKTFIYVSFYFVLCRLYCNSLLGSLNVRNAIRVRGEANIGVSLRGIDEMKFSTVDNHKETEVKTGIAGVGTYGSTTGTGAHGGNESLSSVQPVSHTDGSKAVEIGPELELAQPQI